MRKRTYGTYSIMCMQRLVKVKLFLGLTKYHTMKAYWGSGCIAPRILGHGTRWR